MKNWLPRRKKCIVQIALPVLDALLVDRKCHRIRHIGENALSIFETHFHPICRSCRGEKSDILDGILWLETKAVGVILRSVSKHVLDTPLILLRQAVNLSPYKGTPSRGELLAYAEKM